MPLKRTVDPATSLLSSAEIRRQCNIADDDTTHDTQLALLADAAVREIERYTRRSLITQTWQLDTAPRVRIDLPRPPLISVTSMQILDDDAVYQTISTDDYAVSAGNDPGSIRMIESWPSWYEYENFPVRITYTAGYGSSASDVPASFRLLALQLVDFWFEFRGDGGMNQRVPMQLRAAMDGLRSGTTAGYFNERV